MQGVVAHLERIGSANRMRQLRGERRRDGLKVVRLAAVVDRHLPPLAVAHRRAEALHARRRHQLLLMLPLLLEKATWHKMIQNARERRRRLGECHDRQGG